MAGAIKSSKDINISEKYELLYESEVVDCNGYGLALRHKKSGARIAIVSNEDDNKVFCISFRTPPKDDTGVAHIVEHTVLCGSEKYPAKDPMMELCKGSLNTFINAFTYPDKTCYPVASCNDKDFANLCNVYMDAVLHPLFYREEKIFRQEGWHYEINSEEEPITINGVVYSEMKGAFSSPDDRQTRETFSALFPDTPYGVESGGDPKSIPDLTYEDYLDFHRRYYHPSNSYIYLYGDMDIEERLEWLDRDYLSAYDAIQVSSAIPFQKPIGTVELKNFYHISDDEDEENATYLTCAFSCAEYDKQLENLALSKIFDILFNTPGAPIREALIKAGIGQDIDGGIWDEILQPFAMIIARNANPSDMPEFKRIISEELNKAIEQGLDREALLGVINRSEFTYCEADYGRMPKGLAYCTNALSTWLYDDAAAFDALNRKPLYAKLRELLDTDYFEELARKYVLDSKSMVYYTMAPQKGDDSKESDKLAKKLEAYKASLSKDELRKLIKENEELKAYQTEPSSEEALRSIPMLTREDLNSEPLKIYNEEIDINGYKTILHDIDTNGIYYIKMLFDLDILKTELVPYLGLATRFWGMMNTSKNTYGKLDTKINIHTGGIDTSLVVVPIYGEDDGYRPYLDVSCSVMGHELETCIGLVAEEILDTDFSDVSRAREILGEVCSGLRESLQSSGHLVALAGANKAIDSASAFKAMFSGHGFYKFALELYKGSDEELIGALKKMKDAIASILGNDNLMLSLTCRKDMVSALSDKLSIFTDRLGKVRKADSECIRRGALFEKKTARSAVKSSGEVYYAALSGKIGQLPVETQGIIQLASEIVTSDYLWNKVRIVNGAYGVGMTYNPINRIAYFYSYRDPKFKESLEVYRGVVSYLQDFDVDEREMTKYVIGRVGTADTPMSASALGNTSLMMYVGNVCEEDRKKRRAAILTVTPEKIREAAKALSDLFVNDNYCVVGNETGIMNGKDMFDSIENLL